MSQRPLEPDTASTVEGRNSQSLTVPSLFSGGAVLFFMECGALQNGAKMSAVMKSEPGAVATGLNFGDTQ